MNLPRLPLALAAALALASPLTAASSSPAEERLAATFVLTQGRLPSPAETAHWAARAPLSVAQLAGALTDQLRTDRTQAQAVHVRAFVDAFGRAPGQGELPEPDATGTSYTALVERHARWLADHPADYAAVIERAYQRVIRRGAYDVEHTYWRAHPPLPYVMLVGCIESWARRNAPGLMATTGLPSVSINSDHLATVRLSPADATEVRAAFGFVPHTDTHHATIAGRHVIAPAASTLLSLGGIHFVAAGKADEAAP